MTCHAWHLQCFMQSGWIGAFISNAKIIEEDEEDETRHHTRWRHHKTHATHHITSQYVDESLFLFQAFFKCFSSVLQFFSYFGCYFSLFLVFNQSKVKHAPIISMWPWSWIAKGVFSPRGTLKCRLWHQRVRWWEDLFLRNVCCCIWSSQSSIKCVFQSCMLHVYVMCCVISNMHKIVKIMFFEEVSNTPFFLHPMQKTHLV